jgi:hypothetical protein
VTCTGGAGLAFTGMLAAITGAARNIAAIEPRRNFFMALIPLCARIATDESQYAAGVHEGVFPLQQWIRIRTTIVDDLQIYVRDADSQR